MTEGASYDNAVAALKAAQSLGKKIVFTNGCFDLLHPGHVASLMAAKAFGDLLVVGLNDDESVRRLKGPSRPLFPLEYRKAMLEALKPVDAVVPFGEDTPLALIKALRPDVLVKGGDYTIESVVGHEIVLARGGRVEIVPLEGGWSTTGMVEKLNCPTPSPSPGLEDSPQGEGSRSDGC